MRIIHIIKHAKIFIALLYTIQIYSMEDHEYDFQLIQPLTQEPIVTLNRMDQFIYGVRCIHYFYDDMTASSFAIVDNTSTPILYTYQKVDESHYYFVTRATLLINGNQPTFAMDNTVETDHTAYDNTYNIYHHLMARQKRWITISRWITSLKKRLSFSR